MKRFYFVGLTIILIMAVGLIGYGTYLNRTDESHIQMQMENKTIPLQGEKAKFRNLHPVFVLDTINLTSEEMADAVTLVEGKIENIFVDKNSRISKGQVLVEIFNEEIPLKIKQVESLIAKAEAQVVQTRNSFARYERLKEKNATSLEKYDEAKLNFEAAKASLGEAQAQRDQLLMQNTARQVVSPISGEVLILYKQIGAFVTAGTPVALIGNFSKLNFSLPIEDANLKQFSPKDTFQLNFKNSQMIQKAYDTEYSAGNLGNDQTFPVYVKEVIPSLDKPATMRKIVFEIDNSAGILEQQTYNGVELIVNTSHMALAVPISAISDKNKNSVFTVNAENVLKRREVRIGSNDGKYVEILSGLSEGEIVVTSAQKDLEDGMKVTVNLNE